MTELLLAPAPKRCNARVKPHRMQTLHDNASTKEVLEKNSTDYLAWGAAPCTNPMNYFRVPVRPWLTICIYVYIWYSYYSGVPLSVCCTFWEPESIIKYLFILSLIEACLAKKSLFFCHLYLSREKWPPDNENSAMGFFLRCRSWPYIAGTLKISFGAFPNRNRENLHLTVVLAIAIALAWSN